MMRWNYDRSRHGSFIKENLVVFEFVVFSILGEFMVTRSATSPLLIAIYVRADYRRHWEVITVI
jgi:hypothetical protein